MVMPLPPAVDENGAAPWAMAEHAPAVRATQDVEHAAAALLCFGTLKQMNRRDYGSRVAETRPPPRPMPCPESHQIGTATENGQGPLVDGLHDFQNARICRDSLRAAGGGEPAGSEERGPRGISHSARILAPDTVQAQSERQHKRANATDMAGSPVSRVTRRNEKGTMRMAGS